MPRKAELLKPVEPKSYPPSLVDHLPARHWLLKTEPDVFSFHDLLRKGTERWDGVRNFQARNFMRDEMRLGDKVLIYHSNATPPGVAGLAEVVASAEPDLSALDPKSEYFDSRATAASNPWCCVAVGRPQAGGSVFVSLAELREDAALRDMLLLKKGQRLSILPLKPTEYRRICELMKKEKS